MNKRQLAKFGSVRFVQGFLRKCANVALTSEVPIREVVLVRAGAHMEAIKKSGDLAMCPDAPRGLTRAWVLLALLALAKSLYGSTESTEQMAEAI